MLSAKKIKHLNLRYKLWKPAKTIFQTQNHNLMYPVKTRQQIADEYGIHRTTLNRWLKRAKIELSNGLISPLAQQAIYAEFGYPKPTQKSKH
jgi:DNA invertase Pin-like site-specific DNA recombinase